MLYFAYGSNLLTGRLRARCPSAQPIAAGTVTGHRLAWHKASVKDGSGKCDLFATGAMTEHAWGVVYLMDPDEVMTLDAIEGLGIGYDAKTVSIATVDGVLTARTYVATLLDPALRPFPWYKAYVAEGAREHGLPEDWQAAIAAVETVPDPDPERTAREAAHLAEILGTR